MRAGDHRAAGRKRRSSAASGWREPVAWTCTLPLTSVAAVGVADGGEVRIIDCAARPRRTRRYCRPRPHAVPGRTAREPAQELERVRGGGPRSGSVPCSSIKCLATCLDITGACGRPLRARGRMGRILCATVRARDRRHKGIALTRVVLSRMLVDVALEAP